MICSAGVRGVYLCLFAGRDTNEGNWALEGLVRLTKRGRFEESEAGKEAKANAEELGSPVITFVREWCDVKTGKQTRCQDMYETYGRWTHDAGRSKMGRTRFHEEFRRAFPDCARARVRVEVGDNPVFVFSNIEIQNEHGVGYL